MNEAAERLRNYTQSMTPKMLELLAAALAAERRATVERLREWLRHSDRISYASWPGVDQALDAFLAFDAFLEVEAQR
jgi:hypothetical protein